MWLEQTGVCNWCGVSRFTPRVPLFCSEYFPRIVCICQPSPGFPVRVAFRS